jgi:threonine/homoserine/homoserine lactone efflux protein
MPSLTPLLMVAAIWTVAAITPGPNFLMTLRISATQSRAQGLMAVAGIGVGTTVWGCAGFFGIHALFTTAPWLYLGFKVVGGIYVIFLGSRLLMRNRNPSASARGDSASHLSNIAAFRLGLMTNLANPKSALFMASVFATAMPAGPSLVLGALAIALMTTISITWYVFVTSLFTIPWVSRAFERARLGIDRVAGTLFIVFGVRLVLKP